MTMDYSDDSDEIIDTSASSPLLGSRLIQNGNGFAGVRASESAALITEDHDTYKSRWRSIRVLYFTQFLSSITFTITMSSIWPFLNELTSSPSTGFLGWVVASYSLGQLFASPFFGAWSNYRKSSREPLIVTLAIGVLSNVFYMYLQSLPDHRNYFMILSRGLVGVSAGNIAVVRSYISGATTVKERTSCMTNVSICQVIGFIMGPVIQAAVVPLSFPGPIEKEAFHLNMYTASSFISAIITLANLIFVICIFKEHRISDEGITPPENVQEDEEAADRGTIPVVGSTKTDDVKPDLVAVFSAIFFFFVTLFMFTMVETLATPVTMHMYGWSKSRATLYQGFILGGGGVVSLFVFVGIKPLVKRFSERSLLLAGFVFCLLGYFVFISWGSKGPPVAIAPIKNNSMPISTAEAILDDSRNGSYEHFVMSMPDETLKSNRLTPNTQSDPHANGMHGLMYSPGLESAYRHQNSPQESEGDPNINVAIMKSDFRNSKADISTNQSHGLSGKKDPVDGIQSSSNHQNIGSNDISLSTAAIYDLQQANNTSTPGTTRIVKAANATVTPEGCPWQYTWCTDTPVIYLPQYLCASTLVSTGYPLCQVFTYTIYSKLLGPSPQGLWMGWLTAAGSLARTLGPIYISNMYGSYGPRVTYGSAAALIFITILFYLVVYRRLVPYSRDRKPSALLKFGRNNTNTSG